jgi:hypothetical protein
MEMYGRLEAYNQQHGHCNVPKKYPDYRQLANWVATQRVSQKHAKQTDKSLWQRIGLLNKLGFCW